MFRLWNVGSGNGEERGVPTVKRRDMDGTVKEFVRVPRIQSGCICQSEPQCRCGRDQFVEHKPGNVYFSAPGYQFMVIPRGASFDVPAGASAKAIQEMCPHLITQEEYDLRQQESSAPESKPVDKPKK